jgi:hypothetical protein
MRALMRESLRRRCRTIHDREDATTLCSRSKNTSKCELCDVYQVKFAQQYANIETALLARSSYFASPPAEIHDYLRNQKSWMTRSLLLAIPDDPVLFQNRRHIDNDAKRQTIFCCGYLLDLLSRQSS